MELGDSNELKVGIPSMDREHHGQLSLLNDLKAAVRAGADDSVIYALLAELVEDTNLHFLTEQLAMKLHAYEAYEMHLLEHQRLLLEIRSIKTNLANGTSSDLHSLIEALRGWLVVHIQTADKALADYLLSRSSADSMS